MTRSRSFAALLAALALAVAGCGGDDGGNGDGAGGAEGGATQQASPQDTFASTCGGCHTLSAAGTGGQTGPNLDELQPDVDRVLSAIESGPGVMPENLLQGDQAQAVAEYVAENAGS